MHANIFPGGNEQIEAETRELRKILDFRYSTSDVKSTFVHAAAIFYISDDKSEKRITDSILHNGASVVTRSDSVLIYNFLKRRIGVKSNILDKYQNFSESQKYFMVAGSSTVELKNHYRELSNFGKFEVALFSVSIILIQYQNKYPERYDDFVESLMEHVVEYARSMNVLSQIDDFGEFINSRISFFIDELNSLREGGDYIPGHFYDVFYINPLQEEPGFSMRLDEIAIFYPALIKMIVWTQDGTKALLAKGK